MNRALVLAWGIPAIVAGCTLFAVLWLLDKLADLRERIRAAGER